MTALPDSLVELLPAHLSRQPWYAATDRPEPKTLTVGPVEELWAGPDGAHRLLWAVVDVDGTDYQLLVGERPGGEPAEFLNVHERAMVGAAGSRYYYDATVDPELSLRLLGLVTGADAHPEHVRTVATEQSHTSLIFDDRVVVKIYRRLFSGANPDVEVPEALAKAGFAYVAAPLGTWRSGQWELAFAQEFLAGAAEGWALALTSLRDLYNSGLADPGEAGGDFAAEVARLGRMTAELHLALADVFGAGPAPADGPASFGGLVDSLEQRLRSLGDVLGPGVMSQAEGFFARLRAVRDTGVVLRPHGDYHLGQVLRTDRGWYVLGFEGEPARPASERLRPASALKDVAGMLRSLEYAARFALTEWSVEEAGRLEPHARAWERHNRAAFLRGYLSLRAAHELLPRADDREAVLAAWELDQALYEAAYEQAYRPEWAPIPLAAVARLVAAARREG